MPGVDVGAVLQDVPAAFQAALQLDPSAFAPATDAGHRWTSVVVALLASLSTMIGQSAVLTANRVGRRRLLLSLGLGALYLMAGVAVWAVSIWLVASLLFGEEAKIQDALAAVNLSYAPRIFGVFVLLPYFGVVVEEAIRIWTFLALVVAVRATFGMSLPVAAGACLLGYFMMLFLMRAPARKAGLEARWRLWRVPSIELRPIDTRGRVAELARRLGERLRRRRGGDG